MTEKSKEIFWIGDRYCALFMIGAGGMGEVWAGKSFGDRGFERIVAIKRLHPDRRRRESHHRAILDEAAILQHLSLSPNIVSVIDLRMEDGQPALIMEYIDGPELHDILHALKERSERLPFPLAVYIATEVSKGLSSAHRCKHPKTGAPLSIVHRDVSPSNIMVSSAGAVMLTDFGIAKSAIQTAETRVGEIKGKYQYMSPEQARGKKIDYRTDYFALGLVLYECVFGKPAYEAETDAEFVEQARNGVIRYPEDIAIPLRQVFDHLLAGDPNDRYRDLEQFRRDIGKVSLDHGGTASSDDVRKYLLALDPTARASDRASRAARTDARNPPRAQWSGDGRVCDQSLAAQHTTEDHCGSRTRRDDRSRGVLPDENITSTLFCTRWRQSLTVRLFKRGE